MNATPGSNVDVQIDTITFLASTTAFIKFCTCSSRLAFQTLRELQLFGFLWTFQAMSNRSIRKVLYSSRRRCPVSQHWSLCERYEVFLHLPLSELYKFNDFADLVFTFSRTRTSAPNRTVCLERRPRRIRGRFSSQYISRTGKAVQG